jgi:hypothetical protein
VCSIRQESEHGSHYVFDASVPQSRTSSAPVSYNDGVVTFIAESAEPQDDGSIIRTKYFEDTRPSAERLQKHDWFKVEENIPHYWFPPTQEGPVPVQPGTLEAIKRILSPSKPEQFGLGLDASGWSDIPAADRTIEVTRCWRLQSQNRWRRYCVARDITAQSIDHGPTLHDSVEPTSKAHTVPPGGPWRFPVREDLAKAAREKALGGLDYKTNEVMLMHGLPAASVHGVITNGLNPRMAGMDFTCSRLHRESLSRRAS